LPSLVFTYSNACISHIPQYLNLVGGRTIKQLKRASPDLGTPLTSGICGLTLFLFETVGCWTCYLLGFEFSGHLVWIQPYWYLW